MHSDSKAYKGIFKSTFLFGFVQVFNIIAKVVINKAAALFLGVEGFGIIGLYQTVINILKSALGLGISQSLVRDVSVANINEDLSKFSKTITITNYLLLFTATLGFIATIILAPYLSLWTFGNKDYKIAFYLISFVVFITILNEGQLSILKGLRQLRNLAKASIYGSVFGLILGVPLFYFYGKDGIVPSLIITALVGLLFTWYYVNKIKYKKEKISTKYLFSEGSGMIKMGIALMYVGFVGYLTDYVVRTFIFRFYNLEMVGIFQAGSTILSGYFGIILTAMTTDYYPRISAINHDNVKLKDELNHQTEVGLLLMGPLIVLFVFLMPHFINILYSSKFGLTIDYLKFAVFGLLINICSNSLGMILLAKQDSRIFFYFVTIIRTIGLGIDLVFLKYYGIRGLGISSLITATINFIVLYFVIKKNYNITFGKQSILMLTISVILGLFALLIQAIKINWLMYLIGFIIFIFSLIYSFNQMKTKMGINILSILHKKK